MISVSVVEDNIYFSKAIKLCLESAGCICLKNIYSDAETALPGLLTDEPDVAIVDIGLRGMDGIELIDLLAYRLPRTQFLVHTACSNEDAILGALRAGATGYLLKDAGCTELANSVIQLHNGGSPMSPGIARKVVRQFRPNIASNEATNLTAREHEILRQLGKGLLYKEIAAHMDISAFTVKNHLKNIYRKMQVQNKVEALNKYRVF